MLKGVPKRFLQSLKPWALILAGSLSWLLTIGKSGLPYPFGLGFWGANGHDGVWHIALARSLARGSWEMPTFAGTPLQNYHVGFDLLLAVVNRLTTIPIDRLYFQIFPVLLAIGTGVSVYFLVRDWTGSAKAGWWSTFFVYFGGSLGWVLGKGESAFWSQQAVSTLINPPFALSLLLMTLGLTALKRRKYLLVVILFGMLIQIKAYAGILSLGALLTAGVWRYLKERKFDVLLVFCGSLLISLVLFVPLNRGAGSLLVFKPFWFLETMMQLTDRVGWLKFGEAMVNYRLGNVWVKAIPAYGIALGIFVIGNLGTRVVFVKGIFGKLDEIKIFMLSALGAGIVIPMFFLQAGTPWNTIQFFYYSLFFAGILAGVEVAQMKTYFGVAIILLTIPTTILTLKDVYLPSRPPAMISTSELEALRFLGGEPNGIVLTYPFDPIKAREAVANPPRPLYFYESTAYVSAYTNKPSYLEDEVNLDITGYDWRKRRQEVGRFIVATDAIAARKFLRENKIKYLYLVKEASPLAGELLKIGPAQLGVEVIFDNKTATVYKVLE